MNKRHYEHTLPNIRGSLSNTYNESTAYPVRFNLISTLLLQITGECSTPSLTYRFGGITDFFTRQVVGNEWNEVAEEFYILRKTKLSFYRFDHEG